MDPRRRHEQLQEMLLLARELEPGTRAEFLDGACGADMELRRDAEREHSGVRAGLEALFDSDRGGGGTPSGPELLPSSIGKFRIRRKLGEGGMGAVYEAEQEHPHRTVALEVLRPAFLSADALRRFEREGEFLARLQHPGIAPIFESGRAESDVGPQPYFAMELVRGEPLIEFARNADLGRRKRPELLARVADAVQHATSHTDVGQILGTLAYMSPEQASGDQCSVQESARVAVPDVIHAAFLDEMRILAVPSHPTGPGSPRGTARATCGCGTPRRATCS
ncbi:MAG: hypothetical protein GY711_06950 [bacterium]|nr:hypothetical protein [bacterium]